MQNSTFYSFLLHDHTTPSFFFRIKVFIYNLFAWQNGETSKSAQLKLMLDKLNSEMEGVDAGLADLEDYEDEEDENEDYEKEEDYNREHFNIYSIDWVYF